MDDGLSNRKFVLLSTCTHRFQTHPFTTAATDVWNYEVSDFNKWVMKGVLDWNFVAGDTLGSAYDSVKKAWKSKLPSLNEFPFHDIDLVDDFQGQFLNEYSKLSTKWKGVVDKSYKKFKDGLDVSLSETLGIVEDMEMTIRRARNSLTRNVSLIPADYDPPQYIGAKVEINELGQELQNYRSMSEVRSRSLRTNFSVYYHMHAKISFYLLRRSLLILKIPSITSQMPVTRWAGTTI